MKFLKTGCMVIVGLVVVFLAIGLIATSLDDEAEAVAEPTATPDYLSQVSTHVSSIDGSVDALVELLKGDDLGSEQWVVSVGAQMGAIRAAHEILSEMEPPADRQAYHQGVLSVTNECDLSTESLSMGIDNSNRALINEGLLLLAECESKITEIKNK